jgi:two-component sensor histidine kinase
MSTDAFGEPESERTAYTCDTASIAAARRHTLQQLDHWGLGAHSAVAALLVSELATNAVLHAGSDFEVTLTRGDESVCIVVSDRSMEPPVQMGRHSGSRSGFGLKIVSELSSDWGWEPNEHGKTVWADLGTRFSSGPFDRHRGG